MQFLNRIEGKGRIQLKNGLNIKNMELVIKICYLYWKIQFPSTYTLVKIKEIIKTDKVKIIYILKLIVFCIASFRGYTFKYILLSYIKGVAFLFP